MIPTQLVLKIAGFIREQITTDEIRVQRPTTPFWGGLRETGSELWLDTGDIYAAAEIWTDDFTALTTNNTLLYREVKKGIYDELIQQARSLVCDLPHEQQVMEIGFILNAVHGLKLIQHFAAKVSVEVHTAAANDIILTEHYAHRFQNLSSDFIIKIPFTPAGLIATQRLRQDGVPINLTLGFGARQNAIAAIYAKPNYVNIFLGRLNAYMEKNGLPNGEHLGERATLESEAFLKRIKSPTRQIAASLRSADQLKKLAGIDIFTIPPSVATEAQKKLSGTWSPIRPHLVIVEGMETCFEKAYLINEHEIQFAENLVKHPPHTANELVLRAHDNGVGDLFPHMTASELAALTGEGKIPNHETWFGRLSRGQIGVDSLLSLAGLASFTLDQQALDARIDRLI